MTEDFCRTLRQCGLVRGLITEYETRCFSGESRAALTHPAGKVESGRLPAGALGRAVGLWTAIMTKDRERGKGC